MSNMNQIDQIAGKEAKLVVQGHTVIVREVTMKNLKAFAQACGPFFSAFDEAGELANRGDKPQDDFVLFKLLAEHSEAFMEAAVLVTNADRSFYERLRPDEFFNVAATVVALNGDFFVRALAPALIKFAQGISQIGSILSSGLSQQDIVEKTS